MALHISFCQFYIPMAEHLASHCSCEVVRCGNILLYHHKEIVPRLNCIQDHRAGPQRSHPREAGIWLPLQYPTSGTPFPGKPSCKRCVLLKADAKRSWVAVGTCLLFSSFGSKPKSRRPLQPSQMSVLSVILRPRSAFCCFCSADCGCQAVTNGVGHA